MTRVNEDKYGPVTAGPIGRLLCRLGRHDDQGGLMLSWCSRCHKEWPAPAHRRAVFDSCDAAIGSGDYDEAKRIYRKATGNELRTFSASDITPVPDLSFLRDVLDD
jgi:hypothetical protein